MLTLVLHPAQAGVAAPWEGGGGGGRGGARAGADTRGLRLQRGGEGDELLARRLAVDAALA